MYVLTGSCSPFGIASRLADPDTRSFFAGGLKKESIVLLAVDILKGQFLYRIHHKVHDKYGLYGVEYKKHSQPFMTSPLNLVKLSHSLVTSALSKISRFSLAKFMSLHTQNFQSSQQNTIRYEIMEVCYHCFPGDNSANVTYRNLQ